MPPFLTLYCVIRLAFEMEARHGPCPICGQRVFRAAQDRGAFRTTSEEIARTAGLGKDAVQRKDRIRSDKTQRRLREMVEIVNKVEPRFGSALMAYAWYRSEPLPGFSGQTAMQLVRSGRADEVLDYIDAVDAGVHAYPPMRYQGKLYRALNPIYAREPLSGRGAELYGGRFNPKGMPALYTSLSIMTALREANQVWSLQPTTLVSYEAEIERVFDSRDEEALARRDGCRTQLADATWRDQMKAREKRNAELCPAARPPPAITGYSSGALRPARPWTTSTSSSGNGASAPGRLVLIDDENRLGEWNSQDRSSPERRQSAFVSARYQRSESARRSRLK